MALGSTLVRLTHHHPNHHRLQYSTAFDIYIILVSSFIGPQVDISWMIITKAIDSILGFTQTQALWLWECKYCSVHGQMYYCSCEKLRTYVYPSYLYSLYDLRQERGTELTSQLISYFLFHIPYSNAIKHMCLYFHRKRLWAYMWARQNKEQRL